MAIALDAVSSAQGNTNVLTWSHTVGAGDNRLLVVCINSQHSVGQTVNSVTYGGVDLVSDATASRVGAGSHIWHLAAPAVGTADIVVTMAISDQLIAGAISVFGVSQSSPIRDTSGAAGAGTEFSVDVDTVEGDLVIDCSTVDKGILAQSLTVGAGQAERWNLAQGINGIIGAGSTESALGSSVTMSWSALASDDWALAAVSLRPFDPC